ncbi:asparagine synthase-related protein [Halorarum salinum]|uniref:Asparagine synthase n=1 Tax=Halorarum salinum TaxID=2743089 RepID=A0A7D5Q881_9EURY|nr:asparagine synthase-related protein [Halobaculum salinum]QLG60696.1 asparagine synthase [Halobaculum salinum]
MVGICGQVGGEYDVDPMVEWIGWRDDERASRYEDGDVALAASFHELLAGDQPATAGDGDVVLWVWGDVYGHGSGDDYAPRRGPPDGSAAYCADRYDEYGPSFVSELNGDFALVIHDRAAGTVSFVTDRLATRPIYHARGRDGSLVFASNAQALVHHPAVTERFDLDYLQEYLTLRRVPGVKTPLEGVEEFQPGAVTTVDLEDVSPTVDRYWRPSYQPVDRPFSELLEEFTETIDRVLSEWTDDDLDYGLLLSGGSDSRLVQAAIDQPVTAFHTAGWMSREARTARRAAEARGDEFHLLKRDEGYEQRALERNAPLLNFSSWFDQAVFQEFEDEITDDVDVLASGLNADILFSAHHLPTLSVSLGTIGNVSFPINKPIGSVDDYVAAQTEEADEPVPYLRTSRSVTDVLSENIRRVEDGIVSHGVHYGSLRDLLMYGYFFPMSSKSAAAFSRSLIQLAPYRSPFIDNRLLDLQQQVPIRYQLRRNLVKQAVAEFDAELAEIPHAGTGMSLHHSFLVDFLGKNINGFRRKHLVDESPPKPHLGHGPWPKRGELVRARSFVPETLEEREDVLDALPFLDREGALECYRAHLDGESNAPHLYSLITFLEMPVTERIARLTGENAVRERQ